MELDTADHRRSSGVTSGLHRMLTSSSSSDDLQGNEGLALRLDPNEVLEKLRRETPIAIVALRMCFI